MADPVISACTQVAVERVVNFITTQLGYAWNYKTNFENLDTQLEKLKNTYALVNRCVEEAKRNGDEIEQKVVNWLDRVEKIVAEATKVIEDNNQANMRCFKLKKRCQHSKEAARKTDYISKLLQEGKFDRVSYRILPAETWHCGNYENIESTRSTLEGVLNALHDPDVDMVGVHGMAGSGKTALVREVARKAEEHFLFDRVVFVEVSDSVDIAMIQRGIADRLGFEFKEETTPGRADRLRNRITQEHKILLILDNIWKYLDLAAVGIPLGNNHMGCRLLLTSRDMDLLNDMGSKRNFPVGILEEEEACYLFMKTAGVGEEHRDLRSLAIEIAKECGGLLHAILTIAKALRNKPEWEWRVALQELRNPPFLENVEGLVVENVYKCIHLSYTNLASEELKSIFLLCSVMGSSQDASIEELLRYAVGLSLFKAKTTMEDTRDKVKKLVQRLKDASLLLGTPNGETFSIQKVVHNFGRWIASSQHKFTVINNRFPRFLATKNTLEKCTSLTLHDIVELPISLECPQLKFLYMKTEIRFTEVPDEFFNGMPNLEVLHFVEMDFSILPRSLRRLKLLRTLNLDKCRVGDISKMKEMQNLEILVIGLGNKIKQLPEEIGQLPSLRLLDLRKGSFIILPKTISRLTQLEELYMDYWYDQRQVEELDIETSVASLEELKDLCHLTALHICVADAKILPKCMVFQKLKRYNILIGDNRTIRETSFFEDKWAIRENSRTLQVRSDTNLCLEDVVIKHFKGIEDLLLDGEQEIANALFELDGDGFPTLKRFCIINNPFILCIIDSMLSATCVAFPLLETLFLSNLVGLEKICHEQLRFTCFCQLRTIKVQKCHKLKYLFSFPIAKHLSVLQEIEVVDCRNIEEIFIIDQHCNYIEFPSLERLQIVNCPELREFIFGDKVSYPSLQEIEIYDMANLRRIWQSQVIQSVQYCPKLCKVRLSGCRSLENIFPTSIASRLLQLEVLYVKYCGIKEIVAKGVVEEAAARFSFPQLTSLYLYFLKELSCFYPGKHTMEWPKLKELKVKHCEKIALFSFQKHDVEGQLDDDHTVQQPLFSVDQVVLPSVEKLKMSSINIQCKWLDQLRAMTSYQTLISLTLEDCSGNLKFVFSYSAVERLVLLEKLEILNCKSIEGIINAEELKGEEVIKMVFPKLINLQLKHLPNLKQFGSGNSVEFPSLTQLSIEDCPELKTFSSTLGEMDCQDDIHPLFNKKVGFPRLENIIISGMDNMKSIWHDQVLEDSFCKLKSVDVNDCQKLTTIFPSFLCGALLLTLESITVKSCGLVEEIFDLQGLEKHSIETVQLKELYVHHLSNLNNIWNDDPKGMLSYGKLQKVSVFLCPNLKNLFPASVGRSLANLESLELSDCGVEKIIANEGMKEAAVRFSFPQLNSLQLHNLPELTTFYQAEHTVEVPYLKTFGLHHCDKFKSPFFLVEGTNQGYSKLEELQLSGNAIDQMKKQGQVPFGSLKSLKLNDHESTDDSPLDFVQIFGSPGKLSLNFGSYIKIFSDAEVKEPPHLKHFVLSQLYNLQQIWKQGSKVDLLEILQVQSCASLTNLMPPSSSFAKLTILEVWGCEQLKNLLTVSTAKSLVQLEKLEVFDCKMLTEIVPNEGATTEKITFSKMKSLSLSYLESLASFCPTKHNLNFPILESLVVNECPKMKCFSRGAANAPRYCQLKLNWKAIKRSGEVDINTTIQQNIEKRLLGREDCNDPSID